MMRGRTVHLFLEEFYMLAVLLTHADAQKVESKRFRGLSDQGRNQVDELAYRFRTLAKNVIASRAIDQVIIEEVISSPLARCIETALCFSSAINDLTATSELRVHDRLREQLGGQLSARDLISVLDETVSEAVIICAHGDLAGALPPRTILKPEYNNKGWFTVRPVIVVVEYKRGSEWENAKILYCESPANKWETLLA
jgi:phosphohistidine phosphatase SixA